MKKIIFLLLVSSLLYGCPNRISLLSPHMPADTDHRASSPTDCLGCHELDSLSKDHRIKDKENCIDCHQLTPGGLS